VCSFYSILFYKGGGGGGGWGVGGVGGGCGGGELFRNVCK
jgi:hypothetical protein